MFIVILWGNAIIKGSKKISDVPEKLVESVKEYLISRGKEELTKE